MIKITPQVPAPDRVRLCRNCQHMRLHKTSQRHEFKCALFYHMNLVTGERYYEDAYKIRQEQDKCGPQAHYYEGLTRSDNL